MRPVRTTDFSTPAWTRHLFELRRLSIKRWLLYFSIAWVSLPGAAPAHEALPAATAVGVAAEGVAEAPATSQLKLQRTPEGLFLSAQLVWSLPPGVEQALLKAVPVYVVMQADVVRERWYWTDQRLVRKARTWRLAYQPLTRQWRLSMASGSGPAATLDYALHHNHPSLASALAAMSRLTAWPLAEAHQLPAEGSLWVDFRFTLDATLLPRPFQLGGPGGGEWGVDIRQRLPVPELSPASSREARSPLYPPHAGTAMGESAPSA